jgi:uncharacterized protein (DUF1330 family)
MAVYFMAQIFRVTDAPRYEQYTEAVVPIIQEHGGEYILRSDQVNVVAGEVKPQRVVLIRFPDRQALSACFGSPAYAEVAPLREASTESAAFVIEEE